MVDFTALLNKPAFEAKKPEALPAGDYTGVIKSYELGDNNAKKTPYVRYMVALVDWPDDVADSEKEGIVLSKRQLRRDYFLRDAEGSDGILWRLDEFLRSCDIDGKGRRYDELIPEAVGKSVKVSVKQYMGKNNEIGNEIGNLVGITSAHLVETGVEQSAPVFLSPA